jgi:hypothetical protein
LRGKEREKARKRERIMTSLTLFPPFVAAGDDDSPQCPTITAFCLSRRPMTMTMTIMMVMTMMEIRRRRGKKNLEWGLTGGRRKRRRRNWEK